MMRWLVFVCLFVGMGTGCTTKPQQPNLIVILTDDQGYGDIAIHGNASVETPRLDELAMRSVRMDTFYAMPVCSPTRASLLTGKDFLRTGVWGVHGGRDYLHLEEATVAERLQAVGYRTAMMGKWHLGKTRAYMPYERGFDTAWPIVDRLYMHTDPIFDHNGERHQAKGWTAEILTDLAIEVMHEPSDKPFFIFLSHPLIHEPFYAPQVLIEKYLDRGHAESLATLYAMTEHLDAEIGRLIDEADGLEDGRETIVIFMGDNGPIGNPVNLPHLSDEEMQQRNPKGWKGNKGHVWENGSRVGCFIYAPDRYLPRIDSHPAGVIDIAPTLLSWADHEMTTADFDGVSLTSRLEQREITPLQRAFFLANHDAMWADRISLYSRLPDKSDLHFGEQVLAVRQGRFKYVQGYGQKALHDLSIDPGEHHDASQRYPAERERLEQLLENWYEQILASPHSYGMPVFPIGFNGSPGGYAYACAPIAMTGGIRRQSHATHDWRSDPDGQALAIDVVTPGQYALRAEAVAGTPSGRLRVTINGRSVAAAITDRYWQPLGTLELEKGEAEMWITIEGTSPGDQVVLRELRGISFERVSP